ncbi:MFS transporter [Curvibacter sp. RS43]|uniref:MFS transporter n=1 Tax=Curvibacter microcysteis TaxID=3026419 RepID=UPI00235E04F2|nr:MFS transporter [Curvibacter sp. RS43]MDD0810033.1 MFS transporter [Curvibacter sp. RS43]
MNTQHTGRMATLGVAIAAYFLSYAFRVAPSTWATRLAESFHTTASALGTLSSVYFWITVLMQIPAGVLSDRVGPRRLITAGCAIVAFGAALFGLSADYAGAVLGRLLIGLGSSVLFVSMIKLIAVHFPPQRFATMTGVGMLLGASGSVAAGGPLAWATQVLGWRSLSLGAAAVTLLVGVLAWLLIPNPTQTVSRTNSSVNASRPWMGVVRELIRHPQIQLGFMVNFGFTGAFMSFSGLWLGSLLVQAKGLSLADCGRYSSLFFMAFAIGSTLIGRLSDALHTRKALMVSTAVLFGACLAWMGRPGLTQGTLLGMNLALMGLAASGFTLSWACAKDAAAPAHAGMAVSIVNTGGFLGAALLQQLSGWAMDHQRGGATEFSRYGAQDYQVCLMLHIGAVFIALLAAMALKGQETHTRSGGMPKPALNAVT